MSLSFYNSYSFLVVLLIYNSQVSEAGNKLICEGLLVRDPSRRLGASSTSTSKQPYGGSSSSSNSSSGFARFQQHPFFEGLDWLALTRRELPPPFVPSRSKGGKPEDDIKNVDKVLECDCTSLFKINAE
jgi:hypothetical protein